MSMARAGPRRQLRTRKDTSTGPSPAQNRIGSTMMIPARAARTPVGTCSARQGRGMSGRSPLSRAMNHCMNLRSSPTILHWIPGDLSTSRYEANRPSASNSVQPDRSQAKSTQPRSRAIRAAGLSRLVTRTCPCLQGAAGRLSDAPRVPRCMQTASPRFGGHGPPPLPRREFLKGSTT